MQFDTTKTPPTQQEIDQQRDQLEVEVKGLRRSSIAIKWLVRIVFLVALAILWSKGLFNGKDAGPLDVFAVVIALPVFAAITALGLFVNNRLLAASMATITLLSPLPDESEECIALVAACRDDAQCDAYRQAVVQQGRALVMGEVKAMISWQKTAREREAEAATHQHRKAAHAFLKSDEKMA